MIQRLFLAAVMLAIAACGHSQVDYSPKPRSGMDWPRAASIVERGFHEDYGDQKAQAVAVTDNAIVLSDGNITTVTSAGTAVPVYGAVAVVGTAKSKTVVAGQHIYFDSLLPSMVMKRNGRDNRYAVIVRASPGVTARRVFFRSEARAEEFADALEYLRVAANGRMRPADGAAGSSARGELTREQYRQLQVNRLMQESIPYGEYVRRLRQIQAQ